MISEMNVSISLLGNVAIFLPTAYSAMLIKYSFKMSATLFLSLITLLLLINIPCLSNSLLRDGGLQPPCQLSTVIFFLEAANLDSLF